MLKYIILFLSIFIIVTAKIEYQDYVLRSGFINSKESNINPINYKLYSDPTDPVPDGSMVDLEMMEFHLKNFTEPFIGLPPILRENEKLVNLQIPLNKTTGGQVGDRVGGLDVGTVWTYMALVYNDYQKVVAGPAAIINKKWALCSTQIAPNKVPAVDLRVYTGVRSGDAGELSAGKKYKVKEIQVHPNKYNYYSTMMLLRCCPSFTSFVTLPPADKIYDVGYTADFMNYVPTQKYHRKDFAEVCECETQPGWDSARSICLTESSTVYNGDNEKGSLLFVDFVFAGINLWPSSTGGEPYTDISKYLQWLSDTAVL